MAMILLMLVVFILNQSVFILKNIKALDELPDGATVIMSSSVADHGRALSLLRSRMV